MKKLLLGISILFCLLTFSIPVFSGSDKMKISVNGTWDFKVDKDLKYTISTIDFSFDTRKITVPACWEAEFKDLLDYSGVCWYRTFVEIPDNWRKKRIVLTFDAVDYFAEIWINKGYAGNHEGGYLPFSFEIQDKVKPGDKAEIIVKQKQFVSFDNARDINPEK